MKAINHCYHIPSLKAHKTKAHNSLTAKHAVFFFCKFLLFSLYTINNSSGSHGKAKSPWRPLASCFDWLHFSWYLERYLRGECDLIWLTFYQLLSNIQACTLMKIILLCSTTADTNNAEVKVKLCTILFSLCIYKSHRLLLGYDVNTNDFSNNIHIVRK